MLRGLKQTLCAPGRRDPTETETELCLSVSCGGIGQQWTAAGAGALGAEEVAINPTIEPSELTQDWERNSWAQTEIVCTRTQEKEAVTPQETCP